MSIEQKLLDKVRGLSPDKQREVLEFAQSLSAEETPGPLHSLEGLWADLDIQITEEDIIEARREMWGNFPRDLKA